MILTDSSLTSHPQDQVAISSRHFSLRRIDCAPSHSIIHYPKKPRIKNTLLMMTAIVLVEGDCVFAVADIV